MFPKVNTICMNLFLEHLSQSIGAKEAIVVIDGAAWHRSLGLKVPSNIEIVYLPPYSPELNPVERLWLYIKQAILKNRIYESISDLEDALCHFIQHSLTVPVIKSLCNAHYL